MPPMRIPATLVVAALLAVPTIASANVSAECVDADTVKVNLTGFNPTPYEARYVFNPGPSGQLAFNGPNHSFVTEGVVGPGFVSVLAYGETYTAAYPACRPLPPPPVPDKPKEPVPAQYTPPVVVTPPPVVNPPAKVKKRFNCRNIPRGAHRSWYRRLRCPIPPSPPRFRIPPPRTPAVTG